MLRALLLRGLLAGLLAGLLSASLAFTLGEPSVDAAIAIEESAAPAPEAAPPPGAAEEEVAVSRPVQKGGLVVASGLYGLGVGLVFAVAYVLVAGRLGPRHGPWLALALAAGLFVCVLLPAALKYPPNPPAVGDPDSIGTRTWTYLVMLAAGVLALWAGARAARWPRLREPVARLLASGALTLVTLAIAWVLLPGAEAVPATIPAGLLWEFRIASITTQAVLWLGVGVGFALLSARAAGRPVVGLRRPPAPRGASGTDAATA